MTPIDTSFLPVRSRFDYNVGGDATSLTAALPPRAWEYREETTGGRRIAAGGQGASHIIRVDEILVLTLRFRETDLPAVLDLIAWGQMEETFTWYPDANELGISFLVWLHAPAAGTPVMPTRLQEFPKVLELTIELRRADVPEEPWGLDYYGDL
jgi:hypothetical protein